VSVEWIRLAHEGHETSNAVLNISVVMKIET
jgi:hypothetical protein